MHHVQEVVNWKLLLYHSGKKKDIRSGFPYIGVETSGKEEIFGAVPEIVAH